MEKRELNREYKKLAKKFNEWKASDSSTESDQKSANMRADLHGLYHADPEFTASPKNLRIALVINRILRVIPLHWFGNHIEI